MHVISVPSVDATELLQFPSFYRVIVFHVFVQYQPCGHVLSTSSDKLQLLMSTAGCPYSCVKRAPHVFSFSDDIGTARAVSQGRSTVATWLHCVVTHIVVLLSSI